MHLLKHLLPHRRANGGNLREVPPDEAYAGRHFGARGKINLICLDLKYI